MAVARLKLPFGLFPPQYDENDVLQWNDYCNVTDVSSNLPDEIVLIDLNLSGKSLANLLKIDGISVATAQDQFSMGVDPSSRRGLSNLDKPIKEK